MPRAINNGYRLHVSVTGLVPAAPRRPHAPPRRRWRDPSSPHLVSGPALRLLGAALALALLATVAVSVRVGSVPLSTADVVGVIGAHLTGGSTSGIEDRIVWEMRLPRVLLALLAGAGLAVAGTVLQAVVHNPLADPYVLGIASGAGFGAVAALTVGGGVLLAVGPSVAAFAGAAAALGAVLVLGTQRGALVPGRVLLAGVAVGYLLSAGTSYLQLRADPTQLSGLLFWLLGSVSGARWPELALPAVVVGAGLVAVWARARHLNTLLLGDESAASLGVDVRRLRAGLLVTACLLTAVVIAVAGGIGFVGLLVPHAVRMLVGPDHRVVVPLAAATGGIFLVLVDLVARTVDAPNELPLGIFTAALGAPFFLWLLRSRRTVGS